MNVWVEFYERVMGFKNLISFDDSDISTEYSSLMSKVMTNGTSGSSFPSTSLRGASANRRSTSISTFMAGRASNTWPWRRTISIATVSALRDRGVEFLAAPSSYYAELQARVGKIDEPLDQLQELGILVDRDPDGYLLQIFSKPVQDRPTLFYEIIERKGARSFGKGNFSALFEAIEQEQGLRGNL